MTAKLPRNIKSYHILHVEPIGSAVTKPYLIFVVTPTGKVCIFESIYLMTVDSIRYGRRIISIYPGLIQGREAWKAYRAAYRGEEFKALRREIALDNEMLAWISDEVCAQTGEM